MGISRTNYRVDVVKAEPSNKYTVPCGMNTIVALSSKPITQQSWSIPSGHVAIYSRWVGQSLTGEYKVERVVPSAAAPAQRDQQAQVLSK